MKKVLKIETSDNTVSIRYNNGDFFIANVNLERLASLIENEYNAKDSQIAMTQDEILSQNGYDEYLDETSQDGYDDPNYPYEPYEYDSSADGEALASAGFGTDEDYGSFGDDSY